MRLPRLVTVAVAVLATLGLGAGAAYAAVWESSEKFATWSDGDYIVRNNIWGSGAGSQTIWANSHGDWGVAADHPNTGGVKSYPHVGRTVDESVGAIDGLSSEFAVTAPEAGSYATAYDIWVDNHDYEIMLWMNQHGAVGPLGSRVDTVEVGGHRWDVHRGSNGSNEVFSFVRTGDTSSGTVDVEAVLDWIVQRGWFDSGATVGEVQFGFEITSSSGGLDFATSRYSLSAS
ncbi:MULTISPECIES: hypothetical protein [unclassified Actinopolyspora]|uniref:GH12 family glycosyl hydrolase domain-containing protein n=1 Tax=unclassified Actinopolyspora TaxID=2639451 RepID=UPI0013F5EC75|nr:MULTISPECIES: hypothetical protein [unclassified Actinopolyspora]NHD16071.1 hypothetical protein [Actinopolyspora sp. BKK2]NHE74715.1 hypothetical protein [Actinopolyspora sp. BKK1]